MNVSIFCHSFAQHIAETIDLQATSLLRHWEDLTFRKTVLLLGSEEGSFYEPAGKYDTKCFVVVTIRNSPIETIQSERFSSAGLSAAISDAAVREITGDAIRYFNTKDFSALCKEAKREEKPDFYQAVSTKYPVAWSALQHLAITSAKVVDYEKVPFEQPYQLKEGEEKGKGPAGETGNEKGERVKSVFDGYSAEMDPELITLLHKIVENARGVFVVDSFKVASRNFEDQLRIVEFLLTHEGTFATSNYYLENGHVERRTKLLRAAHTIPQMEQNMLQVSGLGYRHGAALKNLRQ